MCAGIADYLRVAKKRKKHKSKGAHDRSKRPVSIIVLVIDKLEFDRLCFSAIFANTDSFELIVVDNGSGAATQTYLAALAAEHDNVKIVRSEANLGFAGGCNAGARAASHHLLCLLNNDTVPQPGWLDKMREALVPGVGIVGAKLLYPNETIQHCGIVFDDTMYPLHRHHGEPRDTRACADLENVPAVTAACLLTSRKIWDQVDGMDESFIRGNYEDVDFNLKVRERGYAVVYQPEALVYHFANQTNSEDVDRGVEATEMNLRLYKARWSARTDLAAV